MRVVVPLALGFTVAYVLAPVIGFYLVIWDSAPGRGHVAFYRICGCECVWGLGRDASIGGSEHRFGTPNGG